MHLMVSFSLFTEPYSILENGSSDFSDDEADEIYGPSVDLDRACKKFFFYFLGRSFVYNVVDLQIFKKVCPCLN